MVEQVDDHLPLNVPAVEEDASSRERGDLAPI
jgi:hypothetical protein